MGRVLAGRAAAEVLAHDQDRGALKLRPVEGMLGHGLPLIGEGVLAQPLEGHALEMAGGNDAVGVDVVAGQRDPAAHDPAARGLLGAHRSTSRTSVTAPAIAAAATMAGLMRSVRPVGLPCRPLKFRLDEEAQTSRPWSLSSFMPRHMEHPA